MAGPDGPLVGRVEPPDRVDLVAEEVDPDRERLAGWEHVDDPTASSELATTGDLERRLVAEVEQLAEERVEPDPGAGLEHARCRRQVGRVERPLEEGLDARDEDPRSPVRQAASAATRAAVSSATSSLRS